MGRRWRGSLGHTRLNEEWARGRGKAGARPIHTLPATLTVGVGWVVVEDAAGGPVVAA